MTKALLIGAGFSCDLGMPSANELSKTFFKYFNYDIVKMKIIPRIKDLQPYGKDIFLIKEAFDDIINLFKNNKETNYENFIKQVEQLENKRFIKNYTNTIRYFLSIFYETIYNFFLRYHISRYPFYLLMKDTYSSFKDYVSTEEETWILSLNHDLMIEFLALDYNIPLKVGAYLEQNYLLDNEKNRNKIVPFFKLCRDDYDINKMDFFKKQYGINLIKLHGGLNEFSFGDNGNYNYGKNLLYVNYKNCKHSEDYNLLIHQINNDMTYYVNAKSVPIMKEIAAPYVDKDSFEFLRKSMLTGGRKFSQKLGDDTGTAMHLFRQVLSKVDCVDIIGYGFNDMHINDRLDEAMILNPNLKLNISQFANTQIPHSIERHNCNNRIKYFYNFKTPMLLHFLMTGEQKHPLDEKIEDFQNVFVSEDNLKIFMQKYIDKVITNDALKQYVNDSYQIMRNIKLSNS